MRNKYVGDVGDFGKYGLLMALCGESDLSLGVVWYFVSEKGVNYLSEERDRFRPCDPELYGKLERIVRAHGLFVIESADVLPRGTQFFGDPVGRGPVRKRWLEQAVDRVRNCEVVFLDPDTGLKEPPEEEDGARSKEHAYLDEVAMFAEHGGHRSVVVYHHLRRERHADQMKEWLRRLRQRFPERTPFALRFQPYFPRAFFIVPALAHENHLVTRARVLVKGPWGEHFELHDPAL